MSHKLPLGETVNEKASKKSFWLLFRVSSKDRLIEMQKGLLYMNSLFYFSHIENEEITALRKDNSEEIYSQYETGIVENNKFHKLYVEYADGRRVDLGDNVRFTAKFPVPKNTMVFCMGAIADDSTGKIPGLIDDQYIFDKRFLDFGSHVLLITDAIEYSSRINNAIKADNNIFDSGYLEDGFGLVDYVDIPNESGYLGLYKKDLKFSWQREFRFSFCVEEKALNHKGAYELKIRDISDISQLIPLQKLIDEPLTLKRQEWVKVNGEYTLNSSSKRNT